MKCKIFRHTHQSYYDIEEIINEWLKNNPNISIKNILQSESKNSTYNHRLTITIFYEE